MGNLTPPNPKIEIAKQIFFHGTSNNTTNKEEDLLTHTDYEADIDSSLSTITISGFNNNNNNSENKAPKSIHLSRTLTETSQLSHYPLQFSAPQNLEPWLSTLLQHTISAKMTGRRFEGGAEEQDSSRVEDGCPFCTRTRTTSAERYQHLSSRRYVQEERRAWLLIRGRKLRQMRGRRSENVRVRYRKR